MGKTGTQKKTKQVADFQKAKARIGKKKLPASNATDTSFKTKVISMPAQSIAAQKGEYVTQRNLTLKDLLTQLKHYNKNSRKDAIFGLRDLLNSFPHLLQQHMSAIFDALAPLIIDDEKMIRQALHTVLGGLLPSIDQNTLLPFIPLLAVYISNAMTHMNTDIRHDALSVVNLLFEHFPRLMLQHSKQLLMNYVDLLGRPTTSATSTANSRSSAIPSSTLQTASFATRFAAVSSLHKLTRALIGTSPQTAVAGVANGYKASLFSPAGMMKGGVSISGNHLQLESLSGTLLPLLFGCWLECGPSDPACRSQHSKLECMEVVLEVIEGLLQLIETTSGVQAKTDFLRPFYKDMQRYLAVYFPFQAETVAQQNDKRILSFLGSLNMLLCRLLGHFLPHATDEAEWVRTLFEFIADALNGKREEMSSANLEVSRLPTLLPILQSMLTMMSPQSHQLVFEAFASFSSRCKPHSNSKKACVEFISGVLLKPSLRVLLSDSLQLEWLIGLCKLAWQLKPSSNQPPTLELSKTILSTLTTYGKLSESVAQTAIFDELQTAIIALFVVNTPNGKFYGPFVKYTSELQQQLLEMVFYFSQLSHNLLRGILLAFQEETVPESTICFWLELLEVRETVNTIALSDYLGFLLSCAAALSASSSRCDAVTEAICRMLFRHSLPDTVNSLEPVLLELLDASATSPSLLQATFRLLSAICRGNALKLPSSISSRLPQLSAAFLLSIAADAGRARSAAAALAPLLSTAAPLLEAVVGDVCRLSPSPDGAALSLLPLLQDSTVRPHWTGTLVASTRAWLSSIRDGAALYDRDLLAALDAELSLIAC